MNELKTKKLWEKKLKETVSCCHAGDLKNDGKNEIIVGDAKRLHVFNTKGKLLHVTDFKKGVDNCFVDDINGDGKNELVARGTDNILRAFDHSGQNLWSSQIRSHHRFLFPSAGGRFCLVSDVTNDGAPEILTDLNERTIHLVDGQGIAFQHQITLWNAIGCIFVSDITRNGMNELLVGEQMKLNVLKVIKHEVPEVIRMRRDVQAILRLRDKLKRPPIKEAGLEFILNHEEVWQQELGTNIQIMHGYAGEVSGTRDVEIIVGGSIGTSKGFISMISNKGEELWQKEFQNPIQSVSVGDVTFDENKEIVVGEGSTLWALNGLGNKIWRVDVKNRIQTCLVEDLTEDGRNELVVVTQIGDKRGGHLTAVRLEGL